MQAKLDFDESINEVTYLNTVSESDTKNDKIYFKVIILLLCAKLEKYVKDSTNEYIDLLLKKKLTKDKLPEKFIIEIIKNELVKINEDSVEHYIHNELSKKRAKIFSIIWDEKSSIDSLQKGDFVISISNNGTTAFEDSYKKIGFPDIIRNLLDYQQEDDFSATVNTSTNYSIPNTINKVIKIRHEIIHDDATPYITKNDVDLYVEIFKEFVKQIDAKLEKALQDL